MEYKECSYFTEREQNKNPDWIIRTIKDEHKSVGGKIKTKSDESLTKALGPDTSTQGWPLTKQNAFCSVVFIRHHLSDMQYVLYWKGERMSPQQYQIATLNSILLFLLFRKWQHFTRHPVPVQQYWNCHLCWKWEVSTAWHKMCFSWPSMTLKVLLNRRVHFIAKVLDESISTIQDSCRNRFCAHPHVLYRYLIALHHSCRNIYCRTGPLLKEKWSILLLVQYCTLLCLIDEQIVQSVHPPQKIKIKNTQMTQLHSHLTLTRANNLYALWKRNRSPASPLN